MEAIMRFDQTYLIPAAAVGIVAAIILLILRRKKDGVRPKHAKAFLIIAILLFVFAFITMIVIPLIYFITMIIRFGMEFFYAALKSL